MEKLRVVPHGMDYQLRAIALFTNDVEAKTFLLNFLGESEALCRENLAKTCWAEDLRDDPQDQRIALGEQLEALMQPLPEIISAPFSVELGGPCHDCGSDNTIAYSDVDGVWCLECGHHDASDTHD